MTDWWFSRWRLKPNPEWLSCDRGLSCTQIMLVASPITDAHINARTQREAASWCRFAIIQVFLLPLADHLPGQVWKEVTFSKVCLNRDDMWMCWHETQPSAPYRCTSRPCQKSSCGCFISLLFLSLSFSFLAKSCSVPEKTESLFVFNACSIPQVILT